MLEFRRPMSDINNNPNTIPLFQSIFCKNANAIKELGVILPILIPLNSQVNSVKKIFYNDRQFCNICYIFCTASQDSFCTLTNTSAKLLITICR